MEVFVARDDKSFRSVVLVDFPYAGSKSLGFVSGIVRNQKGHVFYKIFIPTAPNPTSGFLMLVEEAKVQPAGISVEETVKMLVSGGLVSPPGFQPDIK